MYSCSICRILWVTIDLIFKKRLKSKTFGNAQNLRHNFNWLNRPKCDYWPDRTNRSTGIGQTEQTEMSVLASLNRPKCGYWPVRTDRNVGIGQTVRTKIDICQTEGATIELDRTETPYHWPNLGWSTDILGGGLHREQHFSEIFE